MNTFCIGQRVIYNRMECIVTNASIARGKKYEVSPVGRNQYFVVGYWEIETTKTTYDGQPRKEKRTNRIQWKNDLLVTHWNLFNYYHIGDN